MKVDSELIANRLKETPMVDARKQRQPGETEWVTLNEAAKILGTSRETVLRLGIAGALVIEPMGRFTAVRRSSIDAHLAAVAE